MSGPHPQKQEQICILLLVFFLDLMCLYFEEWTEGRERLSKACVLLAINIMLWTLRSWDARECSSAGEPLRGGRTNAPMGLQEGKDTRSRAFSSKIPLPGWAREGWCWVWQPKPRGYERFHLCPQGKTAHNYKGEMPVLRFPLTDLDQVTPVPPPH